ncbi:hypothetical protein IGI65_001640 [Enterococcus sp. DIV0755b]|uniref:DUF1642 domain-containing protein n=1 Tax=Enterococcus sp. DIV0755b TaxID=2774657 RepID=UPI003F20E3B2
MKVSEAIDRLKVGDTVWVKGKVLEKDDTKSPLYLCLGCGAYNWLQEEDEISLAEPQAEKMEVPDYVAEWYEEHKYNLDNSIWAYASSITQFHSRGLKLNDFEKWFSDFNNEPIETLIRMKDGYTVKPKRWVVKFNEEETDYYFMGWSEIYKTADNPFVPNGYKKKNKDCVFKFDDRAKAEAVATLVDGTVEEV